MAEKEISNMIAPGRILSRYYVTLLFSYARRVVFPFALFPLLIFAELRRYSWQRSATVFMSHIYRERTRKETWREYIY